MRYINSLSLTYFATNSDTAKNIYVFAVSVLRVHSFWQILFLMNGLDNFDKTYRKYSILHTDHLLRFWKSKVKDQGHSRPSSWRRHPRRRWSIDVYLPVAKNFLCLVQYVYGLMRYKPGYRRRQSPDLLVFRSRAVERGRGVRGRATPGPGVSHLRDTLLIGVILSVGGLPINGQTQIQVWWAPQSLGGEAACRGPRVSKRSSPGSQTGSQRACFARWLVVGGNRPVQPRWSWLCWSV